MVLDTVALVVAVVLLPPFEEAAVALAVWPVVAPLLVPVAVELPVV